MEQLNTTLNKSKSDIIKEALDDAAQVASLTAKSAEDVATSEKTSGTSTESETNAKSKHGDREHFEHDPKHKLQEKHVKESTHHHNSKHTHENIHEIFESLKELEDKLVMSFTKITDMVTKKDFNMIKFLKEEIFHHLDNHHHKIVKHAEHMDHFKKK